MPMRRTSSLLATWLLILLPWLSDATKSFFYNDDISCGYPMDDFTIDSITCRDSNTYVTQYNSDNNDSDDLCWFGQTMDVQGSVTISEPIYRYFNAKLYVCFQNKVYGTYSFRSYNKCFTYTKKLDLMAFSTAQQASNSYAEAEQQSNENDQEDGDQQDAQAQTYSKYRDYNYLQVGSYQFSTRFTIPQKSFTFHEGYIVKAELTLFSEKPYTGLGSYHSYDSYSYKTVCHATFTAGDDEYVASAEERYQYYAAGGIITCAAAVAAFIGAKRRRLFTCLEADPVSEDGEGRTTMGFREMEKEKPDP